jgi:hypothetical protein
LKKRKLKRRKHTWSLEAGFLRFLLEDKQKQPRKHPISLRETSKDSTMLLMVRWRLAKSKEREGEGEGGCQVDL